jgi:hypothetical protein
MQHRVAHAVTTFIAPEKLVRLPEKHVIIAEEVIIFPRAVQNPGEVVVQARVEAASARVRGRNLVRNPRRWGRAPTVSLRVLDDKGQFLSTIDKVIPDGGAEISVAA